MARRIFEVAKEMGIASKAIVAKCHAEGIPESLIKNHMSTVSAGLEATIREWFSEGEGGGGGGTAVETTEKVDIKKVKAKPRRKTAAKAAPSQPENDELADEQGHERGTERDLEQDEDSEPSHAPVHEPVGEAPSTPVASPAPAAAPVKPPAAEPVAPAARAPEARPDEGDAPAAPRRPESPRPTAPKINVPRRPTTVSPAGPKLEIKTPVKLSGPKVVRVEQPEVIEPPRPRRGPTGGGYGGPGGGGGGGGGGYGAPRGPGGGGGRGVPVPAGDQADRGKSRRGGGGNKRRRGDDFEAGASRGWSEQDLAEREARLKGSGGYLKRKLRAGAHGSERQMTPAVQGGKVTIQAPFTIKDLSAATGVKAADIVGKLFMTRNVMATINSGIEPEQAQEIMMDWDIELDVTEARSAEQEVKEQFADRVTVDERSRGPVVTILGHVDHGKTSLLDKIRHANVAAGEAGGITQATSAFRANVEVGGETKEIVFLDTPGHEAFTAMRARGANMTDIVVLVVAADDGVMPQTIESISHSKAAGVPIVVALNKIDRPDATDSNIQKILGQLAERELNPVEWGGDTEVIRVSAITGEGVDTLLETLDYQAQLLELKSDFGGPARGSVVESQHIDGRGAVANILIQDGELKLGDFIVAGRGFGRVRDITNDRGERIKTAGPPHPVQISGLDELPDAGDHFFVVDTLKKAQEAAEQRRQREREQQLAQPKVTLDTMFSKMADAELKEILVVLKADVQGSVDVLKHEIEKVSNDEVKVRVLHAAVGGITESDVLLAAASGAIIIGFNVIPSGKARRLAEDKSIEIRPYQVIYDITDDIRKAAEGLLEPEMRQEVLGHAEVRQVFKVSRVGAIAGCYVTDGVVQRDAFIRVTRSDVVIENDRVLEQLKRFKEDAKEVRNGMECGMKIAGYDDIKEGDILECYKQVAVKRTL